MPDGKVNVAFLKQLKTFITRRAAKGDRFVIICGGGGTCRIYNEGLRRVIKPTKSELDWLGIYTTHLNAQFVRLVFGKLAHPTIVGDHAAFEVKRWKTSVVVGGGHKPGGSTDTNTILFAKKLGAKDVVNISNVDFLYTKDPRKFKDAKKITHISWKEYRGMMGDTWTPGMHVPFDPVASRLAQAAKMRVALLGSDVKNLSNFFAGKVYKGSMIE